MTMTHFSDLLKWKRNHNSRFPAFSFFCFFLALFVLPVFSSGDGENAVRHDAQTALPSSNSAKKILFLTHSELGESNVVLATAYSLLLQNLKADSADQIVEVHIGSFKELEARTKWMSDRTSAEFLSAQPAAPAALLDSINRSAHIHFHEFDSLSLHRTMIRLNISINDFIHPPGLGQARWGAKYLPQAYHPWEPEEHYVLYQQVLEVIDRVQPDLIAVDFFFGPGLDASRDSGREYTTLSPVGLMYSALGQQKWLKPLWYYPSVMSGIDFPVPWYKIPSNVAHIAMIYNILNKNERSMNISKHLATHGVKMTHPLSTFHTWAPILASTTSEIEYPLDLSPGMVPCGLISLPLEPWETIDPDLHSWIKQRKSVVIGLGSHVTFDVPRGRAMLETIERVLRADPEVQILWKFQPYRNASTVLAPDVARLESTGRVKIVSWMKVGFGSVLDSGNVVAFVNHGGANSFNEGIAAGVPQVLLPMWADTYDYATRSEWLGVGVWGSRRSAPNLDADEMTAAILKVIDPANGYADRARKYAVKKDAEPGRDRAARELRRMLEIGTHAYMHGTDAPGREHDARSEREEKSSNFFKAEL